MNLSSFLESIKANVIMPLYLSGKSGCGVHKGDYICNVFGFPHCLLFIISLHEVNYFVNY